MMALLFISRLFLCKSARPMVRVTKDVDANTMKPTSTRVNTAALGNASVNAIAKYNALPRYLPNGSYSFLVYRLDRTNWAKDAPMKASIQNV